MMGPKEKKERALGVRLQLKGYRCASPKCAAVRKPYRPGAHGKSRRRGSLSDFGRQLQEKQKFKLSYGIDERGLRKLFQVSEKKTGSTSATLLTLLERRLDNAVFRLGFAPSRSASRQLIVHGHIIVNERRVRSPGFMVEAGDVIAFRAVSRDLSAVRMLAEPLKKYEPPAWLALNKEKIEGKVVTLPEDVPMPFDVNLLIESFSK